MNVNLDVQTVTVLASVILANIGALAGFFISLKVGQVRLEVKVDTLEKDMNNIGAMVRSTKIGEEK